MVFVQRKLRLSTRSLRTIVRTELARFPVLRGTEELGIVRTELARFPVRLLSINASIVLGFVRLIEQERLIEQILFGMFVHQEISESHGQ